MTERSDGVTDARIQAAKVIAGFLRVFKGSPARADWERGDVSRPREGVISASGRVIERGHWLCDLCKAGDRADEGLGADAHAEARSPTFR